jgi:hypothetical protein
LAAAKSKGCVIVKVNIEETSDWLHLYIKRRLQQISLASMTMETVIGDERSIQPALMDHIAFPGRGCSATSFFQFKLMLLRI